MAYIGIAIAAITAVGVFVGPMLATRLQEMRRERDKKLRTHFENLKDEAMESISIISALAGCYGRIDSPSASVKSSGTELSQPSNSFATHFPKEAVEWTDCRQSIVRHNQKYEQFCVEISNSIYSQGIRVESIKSQLTPCIYDTVFDALFNRWKELTMNRRPWPDFRKITYIDIEGGYIHLYPEGWGASTVALCKKSEQERCERVLREVAENKELLEEATKILSSADELLKRLRIFMDRLSSTCNDIEFFWPNKKKFRRHRKTCPVCRQL